MVTRSVLDCELFCCLIRKVFIIDMEYILGIHWVMFNRFIGFFAVMLLVVSLFSNVVLASGFDVRSLNHSIEYVDGMVKGDFSLNSNGEIGSGADIILLGRNSDRQKQLQFFPLDKGRLAKDSVHLMAINQEILFYDIGSDSRQADEVKDTLFFLSPTSILRFDSNKREIVEVVKIDSIYRTAVPLITTLLPFDFLFDVNNDGLSDIVVPDFAHVHILIQQADGQFTAPQSVEMLSMRRQLMRTQSAVYEPAQLIVNDFNFDGELDLVYRAESKLYVFYQKSGVFTIKPQVQEIELALPFNSQYDAFREDQSDLTTHWLRELVDLNKDGVLDIVAQVMKSSGLLDKTSRYHVHFGQKREGLTYFEPKQDAVISTEGMQFELQIVDFNNDGFLDLISPSYELGVGSIVASLFSSSADLDMAFHPLVNENSYFTKPIETREITVNFNLSSGQQVYPLMLVADFDGDGLSDLLTGHNGRKLYLRTGEGVQTKSKKKPRVFARRAKKFDMQLPRDGRLVAAEDFNLDGKMDLLVRYDRLDGAEFGKQMKILLAR